MTITPYRIAIPDTAIADLKERLAMTRWPQAVDTGWDRGQPVSLIKELADQWLNDFDWRAQEAKLNRFPHFTTEIDGQRIHFVQVKSSKPHALPLILTHGWPSTFTEYLRLVEPLSESFDVVIPSLPGFGFSSPLAATGWGAAKTAAAWDVLMRGLGYDRYGYVGNDVGALVGKEIGVLKPEGLVGVHLQQIFAFPSDEGAWSKMDAFEAEGMANAESWQANNGYQRIQETRPATLAFGLNDSPVAQLSWNAELVFGFGGQNVKTVDREHFLTDVSIYWFTGTGGSAANMYLEDGRTNGGDDARRNDIPTGVAVFPEDFRSVRAFSEPNNDIVHWTQMPRGGHFAPVDEPGLLAQDIAAFFGKL